MTEIVLIPGYNTQTAAGVQGRLRGFEGVTYLEKITSNTFLIDATEATIAEIKEIEPDWFLDVIPPDQPEIEAPIDSSTRFEILKIKLARMDRPDPIDGQDSHRHVVYNFNNIANPCVEDRVYIRETIHANPALREHLPRAAGLHTIFFDCAQNSHAEKIKETLPEGWSVKSVTDPMISKLLGKHLGPHR
jgi:hypothetical protein